MFRLTPVLAAGCFVLVTSISHAQSRQPGPFDGRMIQPYTAHYTFTLRDTQGSNQVGGTWRDDVSIDGDRLVRHVTRIAPDGQPDLSRIIVADQHTLLPVSMDQRFGPDLSGVMHVDYLAEAVHQSLLRSPTSPLQRMDIVLERPAWELSLWGTLAMSLPLDAPGQYEIETISQDRRSTRPTRFVVGTLEPVDIPQGRVTARVMTIPQEGWTFWIVDQAPYLVRIEHPYPGGATAVSILESMLN